MLSHLTSPLTPWILLSILSWFPQERNNYSGLLRLGNKAGLKLVTFPVFHSLEHRESAELTHLLKVTL